jgi:hypothetical protein
VTALDIQLEGAGVPVDREDPRALAVATVRRVLRACGFDLSTALVPYDPNSPQLTRLVELSRASPTKSALIRRCFDPFAILGTLDEVGVSTSSSGRSPASCRGPMRSPRSWSS